MAISHLFNEDLQKINGSRRQPSNISNYLFTRLQRQPVSDCLNVTTFGSQVQTEVVVGLREQPCVFNLIASSSVGGQLVLSNSTLMLTKFESKLADASSCMETYDQLGTQYCTPNRVMANGSETESLLYPQSSDGRSVSEYFGKEPKNMEKGRVISKEKFVAGLDGEPDVGADSVKHSQNEALSQLIRMLGEMIKKAKEDLREMTNKQANLRASDKVHMAVPVSYYVSEGPNDNPTAQNIIKPFPKKRRVKTTSIAKLPTSFKIPEEFSAHVVQLEKQFMSQTGSWLAMPKLRRFPFEQRLEGWVLESRQRIDGKFDTYYYHEKSNTTFRSIVEVLNFLLYNAYPCEKVRSPKRRQPGEINGVEKGFKAKRSAPSFYQENTDQSYNGNTEPEKVFTEDDVVAFLRDSYNNLQNSCGNFSFQDWNPDSDSEATEENPICDAYGNFQEEAEVTKEMGPPQSDVQEENSPAASMTSINCNTENKNPEISPVEMSDAIDETGGAIPSLEAEAGGPFGERVSISEQESFWDFAPEEMFGHFGELEYTPSVCSALEVLTNHFHVSENVDQDDIFSQLELESNQKRLQKNKQKASSPKQ